MNRTGVSLAVGFGLAVGIFTVGAQADVKQYTSADVDWQNVATIDYAAGAKGANLYISIAVDTEDNIYIANYSNILIVDGETGNTIGTIVDPTGTIQQYSDVQPTSDGNIWIADNRSHVYLVDPDGNILKTVPFKTSPGFQTEINPGEIELDAEGNLYVSYAGYGIHFQEFTPEGEYIRSIITGADKLMGVQYFTFTPDNTLFFQGVGMGWLTEEEDKAVSHQVAPELLSSERFIQYRGIAVEPDGNIYFAASESGDTGLAIYKADSEGNIIAQYGVGQERAHWSDTFGEGEIGYSPSLALTSDGALIIASSNNMYSQLIKLNVQEPE